jgi:S1-C subfamily serine protease
MLTALRRYKLLLVPLVVLIAVAAVVAGTSVATGSTSTTTASADAVALQGTMVKVVQSVTPSVVLIADQVGLGSGIVLSKDGYIVTNNHVVTGATSLKVTTSNGKQYPAKLVGSFPPDDLAVIKISATGLTPATFADSSKLQVGDLAIAIGNPLGLRSSVTEGIVSGFRTAVQEDGSVTLPSMIQTSAAINPGNSGGALVDIDGRVIGIPTLAATDPQLGGGSAPGIGFALPSNLVKDIAGQIVANGKVVDSHRAYLGIGVGETSGNDVYVSSVTAGGPAAKAGMRAGDVIVSVDGKPTPTTGVLAEVLVGLKPGQKVPVVVKSQNGAKTTLQVTLGTYPGCYRWPLPTIEPPASAPRASTPASERRDDVPAANRRDREAEAVLSQTG